MTENSAPWNGTTVGDAGTYSDADWWQVWRTMSTQGASTTVSGIFQWVEAPNDSQAQNMGGLRVSGANTTGRNILLYPGAALVAGTWYYNDATEAFTLAANGSGNPRIDTVILRKDFAAQTVRYAVLQGTPAASPVPATLTQNATFWEIPVAYIRVANAATIISDDNIAQSGYYVNSPISIVVNGIENASGGDLETGDLVVWSTSGNIGSVVTTSTTAGNSLVAGVWLGRTANGGFGRMVTQGWAIVKTDGIVEGRLMHSSTAKKATTLATGYRASIGYLMNGLTGSYTTATMWVDIQNLAPTAGTATLAADRSTSSASFADMTDMSITITTTGGRVLLGFTAPFSNSATSLNNFTFAVDGVDVGNATRGLTSITIVTATQSGNPAMTYLTPTALSAGSHTFKVRWKTNAGTATAYQDGQFWAQEVV